VRSRLFGLKRNVPQPFAGHDEPRALGLAGHDETLSRLRRWLAVILGNAHRDLNQPQARFVPRNPILATFREVLVLRRLTGAK
jgi:hypothetical protein